MNLKGIILMKIRSFITCESFSFDENTNEFKFKNILMALKAKEFPYKDSLLLVLIFDELVDKPKKINVALLNNKEKGIM
jgi:hypothetical protein